MPAQMGRPGELEMGRGTAITKQNFLPKRCFCSRGWHVFSLPSLSVNTALSLEWKLGVSYRVFDVAKEGVPSWKEREGVNHNADRRRQG